MRPLELCLVSCILFCVITKITSRVVEPVPDTASISTRHGYYVRQYFEGGTTSGLCSTRKTGTIFLTVNGNNITGPESWISINKSKSGLDRNLYYIITLNRSTTLGEYRCYLDNRLLLKHRIGYILCDPGRISPLKVCPKGEFCVINKSDTSCRPQLDCEGPAYPKECINKSAIFLRSGHRFYCSIYSHYENIPTGYYIDNSWEAYVHSCEREPIVSYRGRRIEFYSTIPINGYSELSQMAMNLENGTTDIICKVMAIGKESLKNPAAILWENVTDLRTLFSQRGSPAKAYVICAPPEYAPTLSQYNGRLDFYILFYEKKGLQFHIIQNEENINVDITNHKEMVDLLESTVPFNCTVSIHNGFFVKSHITDDIPEDDPKLGADSAPMKYQNDTGDLYTCFGSVYVYQSLPNASFKLLYTEKREVQLRFKGLWSTPASPSPKEFMARWWIEIVIGVVIGVTVIIVVVIVIVVIIYRRKAKQKKTKEKEETVDARPPHLRSVMTPATQYATLPVEASGTIVTMTPEVAPHSISVSRKVAKAKDRAPAEAASEKEASVIYT